MVTDIDIEDIKSSLDALESRYGVDHSEIADIKNDIESLVFQLHDTVDGLEAESEEQGNRIEELEEEVNGIRSCGSLDEYSATILRRFTGHEPNAGEVISLSEELQNLLVNKYGVSVGSI